MTNPDIETRHSIATSLAHTYLETKDYCSRLRMGMRASFSLAKRAFQTAIHALIPWYFEAHHDDETKTQ